ncbi:MAG: DJ-1/PfpI family protein [Bacteroidales bacterium]|nr:DJ-1/PfpI family protein [Bacteroidales bacterium]
MQKCYVFLAEGFEETEAVGIIDVLRRGNLVVEIVSITGQLHVAGAHQISVNADSLFEQNSFADAAILILPGGMPGTTNLNNFEPLRQLLLRFNAAKKPIAAICAAPLVLGGLGILDGKEAICYPGVERKLEGAVISKNNVVVSENIITSIGVISVLEFGLSIVKELQGDEVRDQVAAALLVL